MEQEKKEFTMTAFEILAELARIGKLIELPSQQSSIAITIGKEDKRRFVTKDGSFPFNHNDANELKAIFQRRLDLFHRREILRSALVQSNAVTKITVGGNQYTIAEAIELRRMLPHYKAMVQQVRNAQAAGLRGVAELNKKCEDKINAMTAATRTELGNDPECEAFIVRRAQVIRNEFEAELFDPANSITVADAMEQKVIEIESELDSAINISNVQTVVKITDWPYLVKAK